MKKEVFSSGKLLFAILSLVLLSLAAAQDFSSTNFLFLQNQKNAGIQNISGKPLHAIARDKTTNYENSIDPDRYYIGGGDVFVISVVGLPSINYEVELNQQGDMYIPELGLLKLGKITLTDAQNKIATYVREKLKKQNEVYVQLNKVKNVTVLVNGSVDNPGTYVLSGGNRILDAIRLANKEFLPSIYDNNFREVLCRNRDSARTIDLFEFIFKNDVSGNPYLFPGDQISLLRATKKVFLNVMVKSGFARWYPIKENETLAEFLSFHRFDNAVDTTSIIYQTVGENGDRSISTVSWNDAGSVILHDKDIITIPEKKNYSPLYLVSISGEVARSGMYAILKDSTTAQNIIDLAGGVTAHGNLDRAIIIRSTKIDQGRQSKKTGLDIGQDVKTIRPEMMAGLEKMSITADFSIVELKRTGKAVKLEEDDNEYIPKKDKFVYISGNVKKPGAYDFIVGKKSNYYINQAGGFTGKASKSNIYGMRYYEKACIQTDLSEIQEGDIIIVPESQQGKALTTVILPILSMVLSTVGTIVTIFVLLNPSNN